MNSWEWFETVSKSILARGKGGRVFIHQLPHHWLSTGGFKDGVSLSPECAGLGS